MKTICVFATLLLFLLFSASAEAVYLQETEPLLPQSVSAQFKKDLAAAPKTNVFAKVGDSNSELLQNFYAIGCRTVVYGNYDWLRATVDKYKQKAVTGSAPCAAKNSFSHISAATRSSAPSTLSTAVVGQNTTGMFWRDPLCGASETYLDCEMRLSRPRYTFITLGTNDAAWGLKASDTKTQLAKIVRRVRELGSAPVLTTITPITLTTSKTDVGQVNDAIITLAKEMGVPLVNNWRALNALPDKGLIDGLHLSYYGADPLASTADFSDKGLRYGANTRNLLFLRALAKLDTLTS